MDNKLKKRMIINIVLSFPETSSVLSFLKSRQIHRSLQKAKIAKEKLVLDWITKLKMKIENTELT